MNIGYRSLTPFAGDGYRELEGVPGKVMEILSVGVNIVTSAVVANRRLIVSTVRGFNVVQGSVSQTDIPASVGVVEVMSQNGVTGGTVAAGQTFSPLCNLFVAENDKLNLSLLGGDTVDVIQSIIVTFRLHPSD